MFSTAFNFSNLWTNQEENDSTLTDDVSLKYPATDRKYSIDNSHTIIPSISPNEYKAQRRTEQVSGTITQVFGDYGLIDGDIYFSLSSVLDRECPVVGASVQAVVETTGENELSTKQALSVSIVSNWFDSNDEVKEEMEEVVIGKITKYDKRVGTINDHISFSKDAVPYDFKPYRGDWVKATLVQNILTGEASAKAIKPLRDKHFTGEVTHVYPGYGFIDSNIYFPFAACDGFKPQKGDWLTGVAIESDQSRGKWRGTNLYPKSRPMKSETNVEDICQQPQFKWKEELFRNKCGIIITEVTEMLKVSLGGKLQLTLVLKNSLEHEERLVKAVNVSCCAGVTSMKISFSDTFSSLVHPPFTLSAVSSVFTHITFSPRYLGRTVIVTKFQFDDFEIGREILVDVSDSTLGAFLESSEAVANEPSKGESRMDRWKDNLNKRVNGQVLSYPGVKPTRTYDYNVPVRLPGYPVSRELQSCIMNKGDVRDVRPVLTQPLLMENYSQRFSALLHLEEIQMDIDIRMFDMEMVSMKPWREFLALEVSGLAEGRPSVLVGDKIIVSSPEVKSHSLEFDGFVHEVHGEHVLLKFNTAFHESYRAERYNVRFTYSRTPLRRCHQACEFAVNLGVQVLFPASFKSRPPQVDVLLNTQNICRNSQKQIVKNIVKVSPSPECMSSKIKSYILPFKSGEDKFLVPKVSMATLQEKNLSKSGKTLLKYFNKTLNPRQKAAVVRILQGESRPIPYVLFGPPGTGKTITVVETILQIHKHLSHSRVLACTPSNSAADLLAERLHASGQVTVSDMVRLNAFRRQEEAIPEVISPYCSTGDDLALVARHKIIVTTCSTAGTFYQLGLKAGHFTHVFLDEAGQATEPEAMVVIALSGGRDGQSILAGDPCQLGPVLRSKLARGFGLELSLLQRLMDREAYRRNSKKFRDHGCYDPLLVTKLVENYRSHPALLKLSSRLFYHGELEPKAERTKVEALCKWNQLPNQEGFPLLFHGIKGKDLKEGNSPSWFNPVEAVQAVKYLQALLADYKQNMTTDDVGIITPYRKQVEKINLLLDSLCIQGVKVGSVEEFQGQERTGIIISTVRSDESLIGFDRLHQLGFVSSPKRFNVAITRPKALLIIIGNPHVLASDSKWRAQLQFCSENNAYIGCDLPDLSQYEDEHSDEEEAVERQVEEVSMEIEEETNPERMVTLDHGAVSTVDQTTVCQEDKARCDDGLVGGSQPSDLSNSQYFPSQKISPGRAISTLQTHLNRGFESSISDKTLLTLNWSGDERGLDASQKSTTDPKIKDDACCMTNSINVSSHERFKEEEVRDSRNNRTIIPENEELISPTHQFEEGNVTLISLRQETPGDLIPEDATRRNSSSSLSPRSDTSSRSSSPALNDTRSSQDKKRRRVKPSTSLLNTKLACNFQPKSESEEEKCKSADRFIKGKGRGLIIKS